MNKFNFNKRNDCSRKQWLYNYKHMCVYVEGKN